VAEVKFLILVLSCGGSRALLYLHNTYYILRVRKMGGIWWLVLLVLVLVLGSVSGRVSGGVRRRASEEGRVKSELCPDPTLAPMSVFIGLKTVSE
jgi:hypothetical protein